MADEKDLIYRAGLGLVEEMTFKADLGQINIKELFIDDTHHKEEEMLGPGPAHLLGMAILGCMSASFVFCLQKKNFTLDDLKASAVLVVRKNEKGLWRVKEINVEFDISTLDPQIQKRVEQCKKMFEQYCTITQSVIAGIPVNVNFK